MKTYEFTLILRGVTEASDDAAEALYAVCDDATLITREGISSLQFSRAAQSLEEAINSAVADIGRAGFSALRVEADCPV